MAPLPRGRGARAGCPVARGGPATCRPSFRGIIPPPRPPRRDFPAPRARPPAHWPDHLPINLTPLGHQVVECDAFLTLILVVCSVFQSVHSFLRYRPNKRPAGSWLGAGWLPYLLQGLYRTGGMYYRVLWYVDSESVLGLRARFAVLAR